LIRVDVGLPANIVFIAFLCFFPNLNGVHADKCRYCGEQDRSSSRLVLCTEVAQKNVHFSLVYFLLMLPTE